MCLLIVIGATLGLLTAGPPGMVLGIVLGIAAGQFLSRKVLPKGRRVIQEQFLDSTFAVMGALCKADGQVTRDEIRVAEQFFDRFRLDEQQRDSARASFNRGKGEEFDLAAEARHLRAVVRSNPALLQLFLQVQLSAIAADGVLHGSERAMLLQFARLLGLSDFDLRRLEAMLNGGAGHAGAGGGAAGRAQSSLEHAYAELGVEASASDAEVKKAYRRLMSKYHPDKLASSGMPENMRSVAEERVRKIRSAYDAIKAQRGGNL